MKYGLLFSTMYYICGCFYMIFGTYIVATNVKSGTNRLFLAVTSSMAIWSFSYAISNSAPTAESSVFWRCFSVFGWGVFHSLLLHLTLVLTGSRFKLNKPIRIILFYLPCLLNIILFAPFGILAGKQYKMEQTDFGWKNTLPANLGQHWINIYYITATAITAVLFVRWWRKLEPKTPLKRISTYFLISLFFAFLAGSITDALPGILGLTQIPKLILAFMMLPAVFLYLSLKKFGFLIEKERLEFLPLNPYALSDESRSRLFETATAIFIIGAFGSFYSGYFIGGKNMADEFTLAFIILIIGLSLKFIPFMSKSYAKQNTIFLILSLTGMSAFIISGLGTGAVTIWAVYTIFMLYTVVLDSDAHAYVFLIVTLLIQVIVWILYPKVSAVIDTGEYLKRIFIIVLSYYAVRYLTNEYKSKLQAYQRYSKEQETLEKISTSFISVNNENAKEKTEELLEMIAEILKFENALLFELDDDYETSTIYSMYSNNTESKPPPFSVGTVFEVADSPEVKSMIDSNTPIVCEDVAELPIDGAGYQKDFFLSRGINSFFALPVNAEEKTAGILVIEYAERSDKKFTESRLDFLKIITNILGDTTNKLLYEEMLFDFAYFDESTKLANRNMLKIRLNEMISDIKEDRKIAVLDIELENLRMINDTFGHAVGEQVMIESAKILNSLFGECCYVSRTGEGDFAVVLPDIKGTEQIVECTERILSSFSHPISTESGVEALFVIVGIGISVYPEHGKDADTLLKNADLAGYEAMNTDKDFVFYTDSLESDVAETTLLTNKLFRSLENKEFSLEYQPQISCETEKTVGFEALLRWTTDDNRRIPPIRFIPMLEQTGLIYDVGLWVLEEALKEHRKLVEKGFPPLRVSVNLSIVQFDGENFISDFTRVIKESGVDPKYIELEITESLFSKDPTEIIKKLFKLKELGTKIAIDDFGSGYSSLNRLKMVPFDRIKIDKSIIDNIDLDEKSAPITKTIILLAAAFKAGITAEGVETVDQADFLKSMLCGEIQGYYYSRPLTSEALEEFLRKEADNASIN